MPTSNKRRRTTSISSSQEVPAAPLVRIKSLIGDAIQAAKEIKAVRSDGLALHETRLLIDSLLSALPVDHIGYEKHMVSLNKSIKKFRAEKEITFWDYEQQVETMGDIFGEMFHWAFKIWRAMDEDNAELEEIRRSPVFLCSDTIKRMWESAHTRFEGDDDKVRARITNSKNETIFRHSSTSGISYVLVWMWRELLVSAACQNLPTTEIYENIKQFRINDKVFKLIRKPGEKKNYDGYEFWDNHWSKSKRETAARLSQDYFRERAQSKKGGKRRIQ